MTGPLFCVHFAPILRWPWSPFAPPNAAGNPRLAAAPQTLASSATGVSEVRGFLRKWLLCTLRANSSPAMVAVRSAERSWQSATCGSPPNSGEFSYRRFERCMVSWENGFCVHFAPILPWPWSPFAPPNGSAAKWLRRRPNEAGNPRLSAAPQTLASSATGSWAASSVASDSLARSVP